MFTSFVKRGGRTPQSVPALRVLPQPVVIGHLCSDAFALLKSDVHFR